MQIDLGAVSSWPVPNYVDPETSGPAPIFVEIALLVFVGTLLSIRFYTRRVMFGSFGWDDIYIFLAYIPATGFTILAIYGHFRLYWDRHVWDSHPFETGPTSLKASLAEEILFDAATNLTKLSMLVLVYRIASAAQSRTRFVARFTFFVIAVDAIVFLVVALFSCLPMSDIWELTLEPPAHCINQSVHVFIASIINTVTDFVVVLLPGKMIMRLELPRRQRLVVFGLFAGGIVVSFAGVVRTYYMYRFLFSPNGDSTWETHNMLMCACIELMLGIICASIPSTKPFFTRFVPRVLGTRLPNPAKQIYTTRPPVQQRTGGSMSIYSATSGSIYIINDVKSCQHLSTVDEEKELEYMPGTPPYVNKPLPSHPRPIPIPFERSLEWSRPVPDASYTAYSPRVRDPSRPRPPEQTRRTWC